MVINVVRVSRWITSKSQIDCLSAWLPSHPHLSLPRRPHSSSCLHCSTNSLAVFQPLSWRRPTTSTLSWSPPPPGVATKTNQSLLCRQHCRALAGLCYTCTHALTHTHTHAHAHNTLIHQSNAHTHTHTHSHTHTHKQGEVRTLSDQLESVKQELTLEKQKCRLLEQNALSANQSEGIQVCN